MSTAINAPEHVWLVDSGCGWNESRIDGDGVRYIRESDHVAEVERLTADLAAARRALASAHLCNCNPAALAALPPEEADDA